MDDQRLTLYSHGSGCGCKIDPTILDQILGGTSRFLSEPKLLVGNEHRDDAAVFDLGDGTALISTTDFFMPIVDDPFDFGRIAASNAISDIYAMGGKPLLAIAILGWPVQQLPPAMASRVIEGAQTICKEAGIVLAGGHSIDSVEPFFGLAVNGRVAIQDIKRNQGARVGDKIYLTKALGVGIYSTANKLDRLRAGDLEKACNVMVALNEIGGVLGCHSWVHAMTDVTGFGLLGHLLEICKASHVSARIQYNNVPLIDPEALAYYQRMQCVPAATARNWSSVQPFVNEIPKAIWEILSDPQTSGGLLVTVDAGAQQLLEDIGAEHGLSVHPIGEITEKSSPLMEIVYA